MASDPPRDHDRGDSRSFLALCLAGSLVGAGCFARQAVPVVITRSTVNELEFQFELVEGTNIQADPENVVIRSGRADIQVYGGKLRVDGRSYGNVKPKDRISVVRGKVSVNGEERKPDAGSD